MTKPFAILILLPLLFLSCSKNAEANKEKVKEIVRVSVEDFDESDKENIQVADGFDLSLWAPGPLLKNAVAISLDADGAAYVSETQRRKSSDLDIRQHRDWMVEDISLSNLAQTREFHLDKLATEKSDINVWLSDHNGDGIRDYRDLTVESEIVRKVWDSDGDGLADASTVFADGFNDMLSGVAAGVMHENGDVYLTVAPDVYRLRDTDGDNHADQRSVISHGFGIHIAYAGHDMSGLTIGPDGKVYWSVGDIGIDVEDQNGKQWSYPHEGGVMRCNPDGSDFEVFAHGLRNPQELAFDAYGNLISVDNDGDHPGEHERFVHIIEGSDTGWRTYWQFGKYNEENEAYKPWMDERLSEPHFSGQAAYLLPPIALAPDGPAGLVYNPGTALNSDWNNYFFASYFTGSSARSKIQAFKLSPKGASFEIAAQKEVVKGIVATGLAWGPDGALYINDWLDGYAKKPAGRIWKLAATASHAAKAATQTALQKDLSDASIEALKDMLADADMRVRLRGQFALVQRQESEAFQQVLQEQSTTFPRLHAIWGLGQLLRSKTMGYDKLVPYLKDSDPHIRANCAKVLGEAKAMKTAAFLLPLITDNNPNVQYRTIEALGKLEALAAYQPLIKLLETTGDSDPHLRHTIAYALSKMDTESSLHGLYLHPSAAVRMGAVLGLRHKRSASLQLYLNDSDPLVSLEAARAIHDDLSVEEAMPALAMVLDSIPSENEAFLRRVINANLRLGTEDAAYRLAQFIQSDAPLAMRQDALWALGYWGNAPVLDRVEGRYRVPAGQDRTSGQAALGSIVDQLLLSKEPALQNAAIKAIGRLEYKAKEAEVLAIFAEASTPIAIKRSALASLVQLNSLQLPASLKSAISSSSEALRKDAQAFLTKVDMTPKVIIEMLAKALEIGTVGEQQQALASLGQTDQAAARALLLQWVEKLREAQVPPEIQLDILLAAEAQQDEALREAVLTYESQKGEGTLETYRETIYGGNYQRGRRLFYSNNSAQCIRCHAFKGNGGAVGPELTNIASVLSPEQLLEALVDPSARLAPGYGSVKLTLKDQRKITGVILAETSQTITLKVGQNEPEQISLNDIADKQYLPSSMPSMAGVLSKAEIRDLMAFLMAAK
ncbi:MAG: PVC-type heme-binding CxxCH protein [Bacteroidota bacterium]